MQAWHSQATTHCYLCRLDHHEPLLLVPAENSQASLDAYMSSTARLPRMMQVQTKKAFAGFCIVLPLSTRLSRLTVLLPLVSEQTQHLETPSDKPQTV